ncbi:hypothetical protein C0J52_17792 [Blattella germanica]|nr:hypothetical protein C0J52_17792 [Blattella germanica]
MYASTTVSFVVLTKFFIFPFGEIPSFSGNQYRFPNICLVKNVLQNVIHNPCQIHLYKMFN